MRLQNKTGLFTINKSLLIKVFYIQFDNFICYINETAKSLYKTKKSIMMNENYIRCCGGRRVQIVYDLILLKIKNKLKNVDVFHKSGQILNTRKLPT